MLKVKETQVRGIQKNLKQKLRNYARNKYISKALEPRDPIYDADHPPPEPKIPPEPPRKKCPRCGRLEYIQLLQVNTLSRATPFYKQMIEHYKEE